MVQNQQGEDVGKIQELMVDAQNGHIQSVVLASGRILGLGSDHISVPWQALQIGLNTDGLVVRLDTTQLRRAVSGGSVTANAR
jgi:hypothetical protein